MNTADVLSTRRILWNKLTREQIEAVVLEAAAAGDVALVARARRALARRGWL